MTATLAMDLDVPALNFVCVEQAHALNQNRSVTEMGMAAVAFRTKVRCNPMFSFVGLGGTREVYCKPGANSVFKVPHISDYMFGDAYCRSFADEEWVADTLICNPLEAAYYSNDDFYGVPVMPCVLRWTDDGVPVLVMEAAQFLDFSEQDMPPMPAWYEDIDGGQVGWSNHLQCWAAYDAAGPPEFSDRYKNLGFTNAQRLDYRRLVDNPIPSLLRYACLYA